MRDTVYCLRHSRKYWKECSPKKRPKKWTIREQRKHSSRGPTGATSLDWFSPFPPRKIIIISNHGGVMYVIMPAHVDSYVWGLRCILQLSKWPPPASSSQSNQHLLKLLWFTDKRQFFYVPWSTLRTLGGVMRFFSSNFLESYNVVEIFISSR